jgi:hypothetical protein
VIPPLWTIVSLAAALFCAVEAVLEFRRKHYVLAALAAALAAALLLTPVPTHAVKLDLPPDGP